jgi:aryl-alcohol dehydrogenase-like predicted oxidoreductase
VKYRTFGRTDWQVSDVGYGMWGTGAWSGSEDNESLASLQRAIDFSCNFCDTARVYGDGRSAPPSQLLTALRAHRWDRKPTP